MIYKVWENVMNLLDGYSTIASETKFKATHEEGLKILTPKQMLQR